MADPATFWLGLAGILATLMASSLGLYFNHKIRTDEIRKELYLLQIDLSVRCSKRIRAILILAFEIRDTPPAERAKSTLELYDHFFELENLSDEAAIKLPVALYAALTKLKLKLGPFMQTQTELASKPDNTLDAEFHQLQAEATRFLNLARQYLGVDVLSQQSGHMFAKKELEQALETTSLDFIRSVKRHDKKSAADV